MQNELRALLASLTGGDIYEGDLSFDTATGNDVDVTFPFTFVGYDKGYIRESDIHVLIRDSDPESATYDIYTELIEDFEFPSPNVIDLQVVIATPIDGEPNIMIRRVMPKDEIYADIQTDNIFRKKVLNNSFIQLLYTIHECLDGFIKYADGLQEALEDLIVQFRNSVVLPSEETPSAGQRTYPELNNRTNSVFVWDLQANILAIPIEEFLGFVGGSTTIGTSGLVTTSPALEQFEVEVGEGLGIQVNENDVQVHPTQLALIDNAMPKSPTDDIVYALKNGTHVIPNAIDVTYTSGLPSAPDDAFNVQDAIRINTLLIAALTSGVRFRGVWDANANNPDIDAESKRSGDYWEVVVEGSTVLSDVNGLPIAVPWVVGEKALWISYTEDMLLIEGWAKIPVSTILPAGNITFLGTIFEASYPAPAPAQVQDALDYIWNKLKAADVHREITSGNPHGVTPALIGAATAAQGAKADTATQPGDAVSTLVNDVPYLVAADVPPIPVTSVFGRVGAILALAADYITHYASAAQGLLADSALQPGDAATTAQGALADTAVQPGDGVSSLTNDAGYITEGLETGDNVSELVNDVGYITAASIPTQLIINSGSQQHTSNQAIAITFAVPFPNTNYSIVAMSPAGPTTSEPCTASLMTATGCTIHNNNVSTQIVMWQAIQHNS